MGEESLRYDRMVERALRGVVRDALEYASKQGLPGDHHFYLTFSTNHPGVEMPDYLREQYDGEMTIVLQFQFYGLEVADKGFKVTLSFNNKHERLSVPFAAITTFADPSVNFALQFQTLEAGGDEEAGDAVPDLATLGAEKSQDDGAPAAEGAEGEAGDSNVVTLDQFRKK